MKILQHCPVLNQIEYASEIDLELLFSSKTSVYPRIIMISIHIAFMTLAHSDYLKSRFVNIQSLTLIYTNHNNVVLLDLADAFSTLHHFNVKMPSITQNGMKRIIN